MSNAFLRRAIAATAIAVAPLSVCTAALASTPARPELSALVAPRAHALAAAGVQRIEARAGRRATSIQVLTTSGPIYFSWPPQVAPEPFIVEETAGGYDVRADSASGDPLSVASAIEGVVPEALRRAQQHQAQVNRPRK